MLQYDLFAKYLQPQTVHQHRLTVNRTCRHCWRVC